MRTKTVILAQALCVFNAAIWMAFSIVSLNNLTNSQTMPGSIKGIIAILMLGNAGAFLLVGFGLGRSSRWFFTLTLLLVVINLVTTVTDQMGIMDWVVLGLNMSLFGLLVAARRDFL